MKTVAQNAKTIMRNMDISRDQYKWALIVAWLHDVADHKYDKDGTLQTKLVEFISSIEPDPIIANYLVQCVDMVSFSNETKGGYKYYEKILPSEWVVVRNIASDSDKLEDLGFMGIKRCKQYAQETLRRTATRVCMGSFAGEVASFSQAIHPHRSLKIYA